MTTVFAKGEIADSKDSNDRGVSESHDEFE